LGRNYHPDLLDWLAERELGATVTDRQTGKLSKQQGEV
jgi:hypothetical protein